MQAISISQINNTYNKSLKLPKIAKRSDNARMEGFNAIGKLSKKFKCKLIQNIEFKFYFIYFIYLTNCYI